MPEVATDKTTAPELMLVRAGHTLNARDAFSRAARGVPPEGAMPMSSMEAAYGIDFNMDKPYAFSGGIAFVPVYGYLMHKSSYCWGYITGYEAIRRQMSMALGDPDVHTIVLDVNSGGGACAGCFELADWIYAQRGTKKIEAMVDASCYSAAYAIASCADKITITPTGGLGSIGVVATHYNMGGALEKYGEAVEFVYAGKYKIDGNQFEPLSKHAKEQLQFQVDHLYAMFIATVSRNRGLTEQEVRDTEAAVYTAEQAVEMGLADKVAAPIERITQLFNDESGEIEMTLTPEQIAAQKVEDDKAAAAGKVAQELADAAVVAANLAAAAPAEEQIAAAVAADRARCAAILGSTEAVGRADLANHLAMSTSLSVDEAVAMLAKAPAPVAAATPAPAANAPTNLFDAAMQQSGNPAVGAHVDAVHDGDDGEDKDVKFILESYASASNTPLKTK